MQRALRILHVDTERTWRGGEQQAHNLMCGSKARGHAVTMVAQPGSPCAQRTRQAGIDVVERSMRGEFDLGAIATLTGLLKSGAFDLVHAHTSHAHTLAALAAWRAHVPCVVSRRVDFAITGSPFRRFKYRHGVDRFIAISHAIADVLAAGGVPRERIAVVHSGIDPARLIPADRAGPRAELGIGPDVPLIGSVGHFAWHKGFNVFVEAAALLAKRRADLRFVLVGAGELEADLKQRVAKHGLTPRFAFPGFRDRAPDWLAALDVFAAPSLMEGLNTTILDALWLERPVVAAKAGGIPEAVLHERTGLLVPPNDPNSLAQAIERMLDDRTSAERYGKAGRRHVESDFTIDTMVEGNLRTYESVLAEIAR